MIRIDGNGVYIDIKVMGQTLLRGYEFDSNFVQNKDIEIYAYREVYTAGFAIPTYQLIMTSTDEDYLNSFNEQNTIRITVGTDLNQMSTYTCETIGKNIKKDASGTKFILNWAGVLSKNKFNSTFFKNVGNGVYHGNALEALTRAWTDLTGCEIDNQILQPDVGIQRDWRRTNKTVNNYLIELLLHMDLRPSFPLATIDGQGRLLLRDFQTMKSRGPSAIFTPVTQTQNARAGRIGYTGGITTRSFKTYTNRYCGYIQKSGRDLKTGEVFTIGNSVQDATSGWGINTLATTKANENNPVEHQSSESPNVLVSDVTPIAFHETEIFNTTQMVNMSSIQIRLAVEDDYLYSLRVLDLVSLDTGSTNDINNGKYIVEAIEKGFVGSAQFRNVIYLCRDNFNDVEQHQADTYGKLALKELKINPSVKAGIVNAIRRSRRGLIYVRGAMDGTYINEYEQHLISMKSGVLSNFGMFNTNLDFNSINSTTNSLRNAGANLVNMVISKYVAAPYNLMLINAVFGNSNLYNLLMGLLSGILGSEIYGEFSSLIGDLRMFDQFLDNYQQTVSRVEVTSSPLYVEDLTSGTITFRETPTGEIESYENYDNYIISEANTTMTYTVEEKSKMVSDILSDVTARIPEAVDIPIPEITLTDSEAIQPEEQVTETVVDKIIQHLVEQGYIYDSSVIDVVDAGTGTVVATETFMKPDGTVLSAAEARATVLSSNVLKQMLLGTRPFDSSSAQKIRECTGNDLYVRHWGIFTSEEELTSFNILNGYVEKYRTLNTTKALSARGGKRIFVALPAFEKNVLFYINSTRVEMNEMEYETLGYVDYRNRPIPYIIYYTTEYYNSTNLTLELRRRSVN